MYYIDNPDFFQVIDKKTDRLVIAFYPTGSGGKFLINCLALSDQFTLQDQLLAEKHLTGQLTSHNKLELLLQRLDQVKNHWNDLDLGCKQLFGDISYKDTIIDFYDIKRHGKFFPVVRKLSNSAIYFPSVAHSFLQLKNTLHHWPRAKVIRLVNPEKFQNKYKRTYRKNLWNDIRGRDWPISAPETVEQYFQLPEFVKQELAKDRLAGAEIIRHLIWDADKKQLDSDNQKFCDQILSCCSFLYQWDVDWYLEQTSTIRELKKLYEILDLNDFNEHYVATFYQAYTKKLLEISESAD